MNNKTLAVLVLLGFSVSVMAADDENKSADKRRNARLATTAKKCDALGSTPKDGEDKLLREECTALKSFTQGGFTDISDPVSSMKGEMQCSMPAGFTMDFEYCQNAVQALNFVVNAEAAMDLTQTIRTDIKNRNIQEDAAKQMAKGDAQTGMFDASIESNKHQKQMQQEKMLAYSTAVGALVVTHQKWPSAEKIRAKACSGEKKVSGDAGAVPISQEKCLQYFDANKRAIIANESQKSVLIGAITTYIAKGVAAGIAMKQYDTKAKTVEAAKKTVTEETDDVLMDRCVFNPTDPLCAKSGNRVSGPGYVGGDFSLGDGSGNNSFDMGTGTGEFGEEGEASNLPTDTVAGVNSPFEDEAKKANDILDPAAAASMQPGSASSGGGGGVGGGGGGGSASLGSDLNGAEKDGEKEASLKATKASGNYNAAGGGGFAALKGGKEDKNPFASLFDAKSSGGIEEDRSIASGDIDGAASGLFQKISKRYGQIQADKRIEANNLE